MERRLRHLDHLLRWSSNHCNTPPSSPLRGPMQPESASTSCTQRPVLSLWTQRNQGDVSGSVRSLLLSTKHLQELLRQWSVGQATEEQVSDAYVQIGTNFNKTVHAFMYYQIDLSDIHSIPGELRIPLEQCLAEEPSPQVLEEFMPQVQHVLFKLLRGLQARQEAWRAAGGAET
ncbi:hypothetical protein DXG03_003605 [Asterophora parasitica]|uniref:Aip3p/Bud6 N-terminal domain-containing protein n=1 Tax=Asterophora parasitica TaxID=117018 RepID=A0A9P7KBS0_9AGAR|nr:hypothetical protein DXG03_003605 [Asterophora parasitica]